jgi:hypothetical protein
MRSLLRREKHKNEKYLIPLRANAKKLSFLIDSTKSNDGTLPRLVLTNPVSPLSETTDFLTDQVRSLVVLLRVLGGMNTRETGGDELRKVYLERVVAKRLGESRDVEYAKLERVGTLEDVRNLQGQ